MEEEIWKDIPGYEGLYQASNLGNIKSFIKSYKYGFIYGGRILAPALNSSGYLYVGLWKNKKSKSLTIHKLIAIVFLEYKPDGTHKIVVNHKDGNKLNNKLSNLELVNHRYNITDGYLRKKTSSEYTGVSFHKASKKWQAAIRSDKKVRHIGLFNSEIEAFESYQRKLKELNL